MCPICGQGVYCGEVKEIPAGYIKRTFSCGCRCDKINISITTGMGANIPVITSGAGATFKVRKDKRKRDIREYEIKEKFKKNDLDQPGRPTDELYFRINDHDCFHVVKYDDAFKHIDCKECGNDWKCQSGFPREDYFSIEHNPDVSFLETYTIRCLKCNYCWSRKNQKDRNIP